MDDAPILTVIRQKLMDGRLPLNGVPRFWGVAGDGEVCDACDKPVTKQQLMMEGLASRLTDKKPIQFHARCFQFWETERRGPRERTA
jgi:hypothetical protein